MSGAEDSHGETENKKEDRPWRESPHCWPRVADEAGPEDDTEANTIQEDIETESWKLGA